MHILIVDDSPFARRRLRRLLEGAGYDVYEAEGGPAALRTLAETPAAPGLIMVDLLMPGMDGLELIRCIRADYPAMPILVHSADTQQATVDAAHAAGASAFVSKTAPADETLAVVRRLTADQSLALSAAQRDAFMEMMNIAMGQAANALGSLLERRVTMHVPRVQLMDAAGLDGFFDREVRQAGALVMQRFTGPLNGLAGLILPAPHAALLVRVLLDVTRDLAQLSSAEQTVLTEVGNVILNAALARLGDQVCCRLQIGLPTVALDLPARAATDLLFAAAVGARHAIVLLSRLTIGEAELAAHIVLLLPQADVQRLLESLGV